MLLSRVITSILLAIFFFSSIYLLSAYQLNFLLIIIVSIASLEWARLAGHSNPLVIFVYVLTILLTILLMFDYIFSGEIKYSIFIQPLLGVSCIWWAIAFTWVIKYPDSASIWNSRLVKSVMGFFVIVPLWFSVVFIFNLDYGRYLLTFFVVLVAMADIGGYVVGKKIGSRQLIPTVSPKKTWEGFYGGIVFSLLLISCVWTMLPVHYKFYSFTYILVITTLTVLASVLGDLTISMLKREAGQKDTGSLLPGHGGLLDRVDGIFGAAPIFTLGIFFA